MDRKIAKCKKCGKTREINAKDICVVCYIGKYNYRFHCENCGKKSSGKLCRACWKTSSKRLNRGSRFTSALYKKNWENNDAPFWCRCGRVYNTKGYFRKHQATCYLINKKNGRNK